MLFNDKNIITLTKETVLKTTDLWVITHISYKNQKKSKKIKNHKKESEKKSEKNQTQK